MIKLTLSILAGLILVGLISSLGLELVIKTTSSTEFCIGCHEMRSTVYEEYKKTSHFKNASGVSPGCSDCHIPKGLFNTLSRKILAAKDVYHHLIGSIDSPEKFEEKRLAMAKRVWLDMKATDSAACRSCHNFSAMDFSKQRRRAVKQHQNAQESGDTCIDCHKGIAHKPVHEDETLEPEDDDFEIQF